ncbi:MAG: diaminopimelate decarboxylase [Clostridiales bacterium]|jgi:diaminopimelate decarboxylase|nr:diaminopimelate decarboxylase [Clostridiales bacterium]
MKERDSLKIDENGHLTVGGCDVVRLRERYGTPLYILDEADVRERAAAYRAALSAYAGESLVLYASKALSCLAIYEIADEEGLGADVVSGGELYTALEAGMPADKLYFHGNNKTPKEIEEGLRAGVHAFVSDTPSELSLIDALAREAGKKAPVMLRLNPGIEAHTHRFIQTARVDSKFGFSMDDGAALAAVEQALSLPNLQFLGIHCHIGSQIFELKPYGLSIRRMADFMRLLADKGIEVRELNLGGGFGVTYTAADKPLSPQACAAFVVKEVTDALTKRQLRLPKLLIEPGRSIVGEAGVTLYTAGAVKEIKGVKTYVSVDGGMFDNPRYALYQAEYEAVPADRMREAPTETVTLAGKCCESGDMLVIDAKMPKLRRGDLVAVLTTGAYNYSMASHYNRNLVPPTVLVRDGCAQYIVRPEGYLDLTAKDERLQKKKEKL